LSRRLKVPVLQSVFPSFFFKEHIWYPVWICRDLISLILATLLPLIQGMRW